MEKSDQFTRLSISTCNIRPFREIAPTARPTEVLQFVAAAMLLGNHVLDVKRPFIRFVRQQTVLATMSGALSDEFTDSYVHRSVRIFI
jgi:hypothetical protein